MYVKVDEVVHSSYLVGCKEGRLELMDLVPLSIIEFILFDVFGCGPTAQKLDGHGVIPQGVGHKSCFEYYILRTRTIVLNQARSIIPQHAAI